MHTKMALVYITAFGGRSLVIVNNANLCKINKNCKAI